MRVPGTLAHVFRPPARPRQCTCDAHASICPTPCLAPMNPCRMSPTSATGVLPIGHRAMSVDLGLATLLRVGRAPFLAYVHGIRQPYLMAPDLTAA